MLVRSLYSNIKELRALPTAFSRELDTWFGSATHELDLTVDKIYVVYAIAITDGWLRYYVANDCYDPSHSLAFPYGYHARLFEVVDNRVSQCWALSTHEPASQQVSNMVVAFEEWASDPGYYERLVDGDYRERAIFDERKHFMDMEHDMATESE